MQATPLTHVWQYTDVDRAFWQTHLEDFLPAQIIDAHVHIFPQAYLLRETTEEKKREVWVSELMAPIDAAQTQRCNELCYPGREVSMVVFGAVDDNWDVQSINRYLQRECPPRHWHCLAVIRPQMTAGQVAAELDRPGVIGAKVYYQLIEDTPDTRDAHLEASIFAFLPHEHLEVLNERGMWVTLHVPKADRLGHRDNLREIREIRRRYPDIVLMIAHLGRSYTKVHAEEGIIPLADDPSIYFDNSAVLNPEAYRVAHRYLQPQQILYGTDNPIFYMRGRRQYEGRRYMNRTSYPFHFNKEREAAEIEAGYTLYMYEALRAMKEVCQEMDYGPREIQGLFHDNADRLIQGILQRKARKAST